MLVSKNFQVITVTPAPAIDRTYLVSSLDLGGVHRATRSGAEFAGKGVNVTQALASVSQKQAKQASLLALAASTPAEAEATVRAMFG